MTQDHRMAMGAVSRRLTLIVVTAMLATLVPLAGAFAQPGEEDDDDFEGAIEIQAADEPEVGLAPSARFRGASRLETAGLIATDDTDFAADFDDDELLVARADVFADALSGSFLGGLEDAPIVLSPTTTEVDDGDLAPAVIAAIEQNDPETITILGDTAAIGEDVEAELAERADVRRIGGFNRFETAALLADEAEETSTAIVADGGDFPDALAAGAIAAAEDFPILLTGNDGPLDPFTAERLESLGIEQVIAVGGTRALSESVLDQIEAIVPDVTRVSGVDRFETAVEIARYAEDNYDFANDTHLNLARADDFADALALGPHAGLDFPGPSPILLTAIDELSPQTADYMEELTSCDYVLHVAGGFFAINAEAERTARDILRPDMGCPGQPGTPETITVTPAVASNELGETHTVTATLGPDGAEGTVTFTAETTTVGAATPTPTTFETATAGGTADFEFVSDTAGQVVITATVEGADGPLTATAEKYYCEDVTDTDADGICDEFDPDADGDGIPDLDTDGDGVPDAIDIDDDNDGVPDDADSDPLDDTVGFTDANGDGVADIDDATTIFGLTSTGGLGAGDNLLVEGTLNDGDTLTTLDVTEEATYVIVGEDGLPLDAALVGIDERPSSGVLYTLDADGTLYTLDEIGEDDPVLDLTATATPIGTGDFGDLGVLADGGVGVDFNPEADALRVVFGDSNFRVGTDDLDDDDGAITPIVDGDLAYTDGDPADETVTAAAYTSNDRGDGAAPTELYDLETGNDLLAQQVPANEGTLVEIGELVFTDPTGEVEDEIVDVAGLNGFDVSFQSGAAYAAVQTVSGGADVLGVYSVDLDTGEGQFIDIFPGATNGFTLSNTGA